LTSGFSFNRIVVLQSLPASEEQSGTTLVERIKIVAKTESPALPIDLFDLKNAAEFFQKIEELAIYSQNTGSLPLLHIESHGDESDGLVFADDSEVSWGEVAKALEGLNIAMRCNLMVSFAACFGAHFLGALKDSERAPVWCLIGPSDKVYWDEILHSYLEFYTNILKDPDFANSINTLVKKPLAKGGLWLVQTSEEWMLRILSGYVEVHCTRAAADARARKQYRILKKENQRVAKGFLLKTLKQMNNDLLTSKFDKYFMLDIYPEVGERFAGPRDRLANKLLQLKQSKKYHI
jgi:hypothetical protein